jgi:tetratricopeptide (TPR) repeat protein
MQSYDKEKLNELNEINYFSSIGRYEVALDKINHIMSFHPNDGYILFLRANCLINLEKYQDAIEDCKQAISFGYSADKCKYLLGQIHMILKRYVESEEYLLDALVENPNMSNAMATYGYLMFLTGHEKKAAKLLEEALKIEPDNETALHYCFYYHLAKGKHRNQIAVVEKLMSNSNSEITTLMKIGMMEYYRDHYKAASECFRQIFLLDPTDQKILKLLQRVQEEASILYFPQRIIAKLGGPAVIWVSVVITSFVLIKLNYIGTTLIILSVYFVLCIYMWLTPTLYKLFSKFK